MDLETRLTQVLDRRRALYREMARLDVEIAALLHDIRGVDSEKTPAPIYEVSPHLVMPYLQQAKLDTLRPQNRR